MATLLMWLLVCCESFLYFFVQLTFIKIPYEKFHSIPEKEKGMYHEVIEMSKIQGKGLGPFSSSPLHLGEHLFRSQ